MMSIGEFIELHRKKSGFKSQRRLAEKTGISSATISRIEKDIQKPVPETLKDLSKVLDSTSYVELMVVAGYWDEDELLDPTEMRELAGEYNALQKSRDNKLEEDEPLDNEGNESEKEFIKRLELSDDQLLKQFELELDGKKLTEDEAKGIIAYLRSLRAFDK